MCRARLEGPLPRRYRQSSRFSAFCRNVEGSPTALKTALAEPSTSGPYIGVTAGVFPLLPRQGDELAAGPGLCSRASYVEIVKGVAPIHKLGPQGRWAD
jgi:hypothetical protein